MPNDDRLELERKRLEIMERQLAIQEKQTATLDEQTKQMRRENPNYVAASPFLKPNGDPWASDLKCEIFDGPIRLNRTPLTKAEVDALNRLVPVEKAEIEKTDGSKVRVTVRAKEDAVGRIERLTIERPMRKEDNPMHYPSLAAMVTALADQATA